MKRGWRFDLFVSMNVPVQYSIEMLALSPNEWTG